LLALGATEVVHLDFDKPETFDPAIATADRILFVHGIAEPFEKAIDWAKSFAEASKSHVDKVQFVSRISGASSDPNATGVSQLQGVSDKALRDTGIKFASVGPNFFFENWFGNKDSIKAGTVHGAAGEGTTAYVAVQDIGNVAAAVLNNPEPYVGQHIVVTGPAAITDGHVAQQIGKAIGKEVTYVNHTPEEFAKLLQSFGLSETQAASFSNLEVVKLNNWAAHVTNSVETITGKPATSIEEWSKENASFFA